MNRRGFLRSAVAGLLACQAPAGLLPGDVARVADVWEKIAVRLSMAVQIINYCRKEVGEEHFDKAMEDLSLVNRNGVLELEFLND